jgi:death on curing protein
MNRDWIHFTPATVQSIHASVLEIQGGKSETCDVVLLESAVFTSQATKLGDPFFKDGAEIAAGYLFYLCRNQPFLDGNKRTALATCLVFLDQNKLFSPRELDIDAWEMFVLEIATTKINREQTTQRLKQLIQ